MPLAPTPGFSLALEVWEPVGPTWRHICTACKSERGNIPRGKPFTNEIQKLRGKFFSFLRGQDTELHTCSWHTALGHQAGSRTCCQGAANLEMYLWTDLIFLLSSISLSLTSASRRNHSTYGCASSSRFWGSQTQRYHGCSAGYPFLSQSCTRA